MVIFRFIALLFILAGVLALGADVMNYLETDTFTVRGGAELWQMVHAGSYENFLEWAANSLPETAYAYVVMPVLAFPAWATLSAFGLLLAVIFHSHD